ncbi:MAG: RpoL/Rpb11 RNA polymerase subunit family protein [Candidatus Pacearchaeota archaeon]|nr:RpoL/Rpb11 RNA polymerase subunit family protein [Nanoarchaeota archaeon]MDZ4226748.1 RpoL/Rpb11 RNA polymerase subunit family protein [Candidatus Pacearchaeota archaeon]
MEHLELEILKSSKDEIEVRIGNMTLVEIIRVYLNKDPSVSFAAWKREHPSEQPILKVITKGKSAKKAINDAVESAVKDLDKIEADFKKMK